MTTNTNLIINKYKFKNSMLPIGGQPIINNQNLFKIILKIIYNYRLANKIFEFKNIQLSYENVFTSFNSIYIKLTFDFFIIKI